jgi:hypothetical protein
LAEIFAPVQSVKGLKKLYFTAQSGVDAGKPVLEAAVLTTKLGVTPTACWAMTSTSVG